MARSPTRRPLPRALSAGGVVYRHGSDGPEVVVCASDGIWRLPKGTPEAEETLEHTAMREVHEETGLAVAIEDPIGCIRYTFTAPDRTRYDKRVEHFLMVPVGGSLDDHDGEFEVVQWVSIDEALRMLRFPNERTIVRKAARLIGGREKQ